jgi:hypothetical protein
MKAEVSLAFLFTLLPLLRLLIISSYTTNTTFTTSTITPRLPLLQIMLLGIRPNHATWNSSGLGFLYQREI